MAEPYEVQPLPSLYEQPSFTPAQPEGSPIADLGLSWEIGWEQMKGVPAWMQGAGASLLEKAGFEGAARNQRISARNLADEMYQNIGELESLYSGPHSWAEAQEQGTAGSYAMWGINEAIKQVPNLATMALGALVSGGSMTPALLGRFAIARGMAAVPMAAGNAVRGAQIAGVGLTSALLNTGEIYSSALLESGENNPAITGLAGLIAGSLDLWPGSKVIRAMGKNRDLGSFIANKFLADKKWRSRFYRSLELGATEGFVEDIQTVIEAATINYLNSNDLSREYVAKAYGFIPITADQVSERMEARAAGGLLGGLLGFPGRTVTKHGRKDRVKLTREDMRQLDDQLATVTIGYGDEDQFVPVDEYMDRRRREPITFQQRLDQPVGPATPVGPPTPLSLDARGEGEFGAATAEGTIPYDGGMDPFATTPPERMRGRVTSMDLPPVTKRRLAQWYANKTTQEAAEVLDVGGKPETRTQRKTRLNREKRARAKETKRVEAERIRAQSEADLMAGLYGGAAPAATGIPTSAGQPTAPTITVTYGMEEAAGQTVSEQAKKSPYTVVNVGRGPGTYEYDLDRAMLVGMMLDDVWNLKIAEEEAELSNLQKALLMKAYLGLGDKPADEKITDRKNKLLEILKDLGLKENDISLKEIDPSLNANSSLARIDDAIKNFIGKDLLFGEDMQAAYSEDSIRDIVESEKTLSLLSRLAKGDERVAFLLEKYGIPPDEARVSAENAIAEAKRRAERSVEAAHVGALATEQTRRRLARGEKIEVTEKPRERITLKKAKPKRKEAPLFAVRARGMPSDVRETEVVVGGVRRKERRSIPPGVGPEAVTITTEDVEKELQKLAKDDRPVSDSDAENYTATEDFYSLVWNAFTVSEKGAASYDLLVPTEGMVIGPEGAKQNAKKALESLLPDGPNLYSLEYYEQEKMIGDKSLHNLKEEIAKRIGKKVEDIVAVSPAQTYVVRGKPPRKNIVMLERDDKGEIVVDEEGSPKFVLRDIKKSEVTQLPTRLMLYDNNDQLLLEQMVDDQRNIELASSLNSLKRRYGLVKDIPMAELARIAREFSISSRFVGAVTRRGRVSWVKLEAADLSEKQLRDQIEGSVWFKIAEGQSMSNYMTLDSLGARYNDLIKLEGMTVERAWDLALAQQIENIQKEASIRYDQIIATNELLISNIENTTGELTEDEVREAQRELDNTLKESEAIFTKDTIAKITALAQENKSFIIDPENLDHSLPIPKGAEVNVTAVYKSLRNSISQGKNSFYGEGRLDETQETFLSRASTIPRTPKEITPGTKVSLVPAAWRNIYKTESRVRNASKDVLRILTALERISDYRKTFGIKDAYRTTDGKVVRIKDKASAISREEDALNKKLEAAKDKLTSIVGEVIGKEFTVEGRKNGMYKLYDESSMEGVDQPVPEDQIIVRKYSQQGLNRVRMNEVYALNKKADDIAKRGTRDLPTKLAKLRQAKDKVQEELNVRLDAVTLQESQEEITPAEAEREREKIRGEFTWRVYEELKDLTHAGRPFISLPKEIRTRVESKEITYKQGVREYIRSIKERWSETRIARVARLRREKLEDEDFFLISSLQRITGKWFNRKEMEQLGLWDQVKEIGASLKAGPQIRGINAVNIYEALKERHTLLQGSRRTRLEVRPETFEGRQLPTEWNEGKYWTFVKSADEIVLPEKPRFLNKWVKAVPRQRWKNAYGVIIDKITITYRPSGAEAEETLDIYEVTDPFLPNPLPTTFRTLEGAKAAFGLAKRYRKLAGIEETFPPVHTPSPQDIGRDPKFPKRKLKDDTKGRPKGQVTDAAPLTTDQVMEDNKKGDVVTVTVLAPDSNEHRIEVVKTYEDVVDTETEAPTRIYKAAEKVTYTTDVPYVGGRGMEPPTITRLTKEQRLERERSTIRDTRLGGERLVKGKPKFSLKLKGIFTNGDFPHVLVTEENEGGASRSDVVDRLNEAFGRQVFNIVHVVQSEQDLPLDYQMNRIGYEPGVRGVTYNDQIYLVADNLPLNRVVPVTLHEIGAHGMQAVMGKRFYQKLMSQVAALAITDPEVRSIYLELKDTMDTTNEALILEETMAYIVEKESMSDSTFWRAIVDAILYGLARLKLWLNPKWVGASDILVFAKASARRHFNLSRDGDATFTANFLNTFLYSGDLGGDRSSSSDYGERMTSSFREHAGPEMVAGFRGNWFNIDVPLPQKWWENYLMIRDVTRLPPAPGKRIRKLGKRQYQIYVAPSVIKWIADYFTILRSLEESIKARGGVITARNMPSLYHGAYKNIVNTRRKNFHRDMVIPFQNFLRDKKVNADDLHLYLYANHAPSRNEVHAGRAKARKVPVASGLFNTIAEAEAWNRENNTTYRSAEGIMQELLARNGGSIDSQQWKDLEKAADYIYKINRENLRMQIETGMLNLDRLDDKQKKAYYHAEYQRTYVPLKGDNIVTADEFFEEPLGPGKIGTSGPESKAVHGRVSEAENTWAWSIMQMDYEIDRVEKNKVVQAFARLINENKENLKDFATVVALSDYKNHRDPFTRKLFLGLHEKQQTDPDHNIHFKSNGMEYVILVTDKRIGQAFNRTNMTDSGVFLQMSSMVNRYFSAVHTSINPEFVITNFIRDFQTAMFNLQGVKETTAEFQDAEALGRKVFKDIKNAGIGLRHYIREEKTDTEWSALAEEFSLEGGRIDFFAFKDVRDFEKKLKDYIKDSTAAGAKRWAKEMISFIGDYNAVVENTMRLSTYKNAKEAFIANGMEQGDAKRRAADIARNLTVNFSQKGEKGAALNALYLFFNASVQGTVRLFQAMFQRPTGKRGFTRVQKIAGGIMMFSFTQAILNAMLAGDDEDGVNRYRQIDLQSRGRTAHIYLPGFDTFFKIPLPYGYNIFHAMGDTLASLMMGHTNPGKATMHVMSSAAESFMPFSFGSSDNVFRASLKAVSPTFSDPLVDLALNESYFGQPIYKDPVWGSSDPPSERYWSSTGTTFKGVSRALNALTGGSKVEPGFVSIPPDIFEYLWESIGGGAARFVERSTDLVWMIGPGRLTHRETGEVKWNKVPFARRFFYDETATRNRFVYDKYSEYENAITSATGLNTGILEVYGRGKDYENFKESEDYKLFRLDDYRRKITGSITRLQKERNKIRANRIMRNDIKEDKINRINDRMRDLRMKLINKVDEIWE